MARVESVRRFLMLSAMSSCFSACCNGDLLCIGRLTVSFSQPATLPYHIEARSLQDSLLASVDCGNAPGCSPTSVELSEVSADRVVLRLTEAALVTTDTVSPTYRYESPKACASCYNGTVTMTLR